MSYVICVRIWCNLKMETYFVSFHPQHHKHTCWQYDYQLESNCIFVLEIRISRYFNIVLSMILIISKPYTHDLGEYLKWHWLLTLVGKHTCVPFLLQRCYDCNKNANSSAYVPDLCKTTFIWDIFYSLVKRICVPCGLHTPIRNMLIESLIAINKNTQQFHKCSGLINS